MTDRITAYSLYALALAFFVSVSLLTVYHVLTLIAVVLIVMQKEINLLTLKKLPASSWALFTYIVVQLVSAAVNFSELNDVSRSVGGIKYPLIGILAVLLYQNQKLQNSEFLKKHSALALNVFLATIVAAFAYGILKIHSGWDYFKDKLQPVVDIYSNTRMGGFTDVMRYGYGSGLVLLVLTAILLNTKKLPKLNRYFLAFAIMIGFMGMFLSYTRGAMLGFLLGLPVIFYYFNKRITIILAAVTTGLVVLMLTAFFIGGFGSLSKSRYLIGAGGDTGRMSQYLSAIHAVKERPVFGFGPQQLKFHVKEIKERYDLQHKEYIEHAHNVFLEIAANTGIIGLLAFLLWLGLWFKELVVSRSPFACQIFFPVILYLCVAGQFEMLMMAQTSTLIYFLYSISHLKLFEPTSDNE